MSDCSTDQCLFWKPQDELTLEQRYHQLEQRYKMAMSAINTLDRCLMHLLKDKGIAECELLQLSLVQMKRVSERALGVSLDD